MRCSCFCKAGIWCRVRFTCLRKAGICCRRTVDAHTSIQSLQECLTCVLESEGHEFVRSIMRWFPSKVCCACICWLQSPIDASVCVLVPKHRCLACSHHSMLCIFFAAPDCHASSVANPLPEVALWSSSQQCKIRGRRWHRSWLPRLSPMLRSTRRQLRCV